MKASKVLMILFVLCLTGQTTGQTIHKIEIEKSPVGDGVICISECEECGKLIFSSFLSNLTFYSEMNNIVETEIDRKINIDNRERFTYHVITKAKQIQHIIIKGPNIADYDLTITNLEPARCQKFIINLLSENNTTNTVNGVNLEPDIPIAPIIKPIKIYELERLEQELKVYKKRQRFWLTSSILSAGAGIYFMYEADRKYQQYQKTTDNSATDLHNVIELYDVLSSLCFGFSGICVIDFTVNTFKRNNTSKKIKAIYGK